MQDLNRNRGAVKEESLNILPPNVEKVIEDKSGMVFSYVAGLIPKEEAFRFKRLLFRRTRGNVVTVLHHLEKPIETFDKKTVDKTLYVVIFRESDVLRNSVMKVCESFSNEMYPFFAIFFTRFYGPQQIKIAMILQVISMLRMKN